MMEKKNCNNHSYGLRILFSAVSILLVACLTITSICFQFPAEINVILNTPNSQLIAGDSDEVITYERGYTDEELEKAALESQVKAAQEGAVIIKNENDALPIQQNATVSFFGLGAPNIIYAGASSGLGFVSGADLAGALRNNGINVNQTLLDWYKAQTPDDYRGLSKVAGSQTNDNLKIDEVPVSKLQTEGADALATVKPTDIGIFVVTRRGGEGTIDLRMSGGADYDNYLELNKEEKDTLRLMKEKTAKQIVIINCNNAFGLEFLNEEDLGVDAVMTMPYMSQGIQGFADVLTGKVNPSGRLADTWANHPSSAPAVQNLALNQWTNYMEVYEKTGSATVSASNYTYFHNDAFIVYQEGIYIGYKYYETRYEDCVLGQGNANGNAGTYMSNGAWDYNEEVGRAFGYGESYTTFTQELLSVSNEKREEGTDEKYFEVKVKVTNVGDMAGKEVVQVYFQQPYTKGGLEKSAICLGGFIKTDVLQPNASAEVTVKVYKRDMASFDEVDAKTYVFEKGDYYFAIGSDAHDALNNILAAKGQNVGDKAKCEKKTLGEDDSFSVSEKGIEITNQLSDADIQDYYSNVKYLTRADWQNTWPKMPKLEATDVIIEGLKNTNYKVDKDEADKIAAKYPNYLNGNGGSMTLSMMRGAEFDSDLWDDIIDQMTLEELITLNTNGYPGTAAVASITKPATDALNGPTGHINEGIIFPCEVLYAGTWNVDCAASLGEMIAEDGLKIGRTGIMGPGINIHRTAYSGRNFEYFSEDAIFSGIMVVAEIKAYLEVGGEVFVKHFAFNDQETHRLGVAEFGTEQAFREIYLKPFEYAFIKGDCNFVMTSYNRIGCTWTAASIPLLQNILRGEWGFKGVITTDNITMAMGYAEPIGAKYAGIDMWRNRSNKHVGEVYNEYGGTDFELYEKMRESAKYILYTSANGVCMNGISASARVVKVTPYWVPLTITCSIVLAVLWIGCGALVVLKEKKYKEER